MSGWRKEITDEQVREMFKTPEGFGDKVRSYTQREVDTLIAQARREALEEAAQIADAAMRGAENAAGKAKLTTAILGHSGRAEFAERISQEIRALIDKETRHD